MFRPLKTPWQPYRVGFLRLCVALLIPLIPFTAQSAAPPLISQSSDAAHVVQTQQIRAELFAHAPDGVAPGKTVWVGLQLTHQPQWHTYWQNPGDSGLPTRLEWELPAGVTAGEIAWPAPRKIAIGTLANFGYEGTVLLPVQLSISNAFKAPSDGNLPVKLRASWLVCKQECVPQEGTLKLSLPVRGSTASHATDFSAAFEAAPKEFSGKSSASIEGNSLVLRVSGLPAAWRSKSLFTLPETPEIVDSSATPDEQNATVTASAPQPGKQAWSQGSEPVWSAQLPLSELRSSEPTRLAFVLVSGVSSLRTVATLQGKGPAVVLVGVAQGSATQRLRPLPDPAITNGSASPWLIGLLSALLGGLILNLMPCVFPVLAIKVLAFASAGGKPRSSHRTQGLAYTAGVIFSFMALGGLMLGLRAAGEQLGWGFQLQSPSVVATLALLFTLIGLNLMGLLQFGLLLPPGLASLQLRHPVADAFLSGVLAVAIASPCTAPFMGASLGYAIALPVAQAMAIFAAVGLGLALPYLAASSWPGLGRWLPRPGAWMETLRRFMAFPMWATVVWLVWVLGHLTSVDGAASMAAILLSVALLGWSANQHGKSRTVLLALSVVMLLTLLWGVGANVLRLEEPANPTTNRSNDDKWQPWVPGRVEAELAGGAPVFVDFTAAWCITCQYNKKTTLGNPEMMASFSRKKVRLLRADWTRRDPAITQALTTLGRSGVPVYVLYQPGHAPVVFSEILSEADLRAALDKVL